MKGVLDNIVNGKMGYSSTFKEIVRNNCVTVTLKQSCLTARFVKVRQL